MRLALFLPLLLIVPTGAASASCAERPGDRAAIERTVRDFYTALGRDDRAGFMRTVTPDFVGFEFAERFTADGLFDLVADAHAKGVTIRWNVGPMAVKVDCTMGWAHWDNRGESGTPGAMRPRRWRESAVLRRASGGWRIELFHSTSAEAAK